MFVDIELGYLSNKITFNLMQLQADGKRGRNSGSLKVDSVRDEWTLDYIRTMSDSFPPSYTEMHNEC